MAHIHTGDVKLNIIKALLIEKATKHLQLTCTPAP